MLSPIKSTIRNEIMTSPYLNSNIRSTIKRSNKKYSLKDLLSPSKSYMVGDKKKAWKWHPFKFLFFLFFQCDLSQYFIHCDFFWSFFIFQYIEIYHLCTCLVNPASSSEFSCHYPTVYRMSALVYTVRIPGFHPGGPGSIPGCGIFFIINQLHYLL